MPTLGMSQRPICGDPAALPGAGSGGRLGDPPLAADVAQIEKGMRAGTTSVAQARTRLIDVIHRRYGE